MKLIVPSLVIAVLLISPSARAIAKEEVVVRKEIVRAVHRTRVVRPCEYGGDGRHPVELFHRFVTKPLARAFGPAGASPSPSPSPSPSRKGGSK